MKLSNEQVATVVAEASKKMSDANYSTALVGGFVQSQTPMSQFITAHERELGGTEAVVNVIFHAALIQTCFQRAGRMPRMVSYDDLDAVAQGDSLLALQKMQPALADFIASNVAHPEAQKLLALLALGMNRSG